ncbi:pentatricopeptide repeat-containing protein At1g62680, mitochondrial-like [Prosopis cineraria]|uniref:pentatricopeptide repeat-containing protein At1g62680, mitochondrial-like n=1 Tax=Prosopis cineraria TaxID=364024 RepID=UPI0024100BA1|nr:pentatricopeptide repeat-containing protein At1g62680, mitochondrial-like [Prosopis cineraria]
MLSQYVFCKFPLLSTSSASFFLLSLPFALSINFRFHSYGSNPRNIEKSVTTFHALLHRHPRPSTIQISKILGSITRIKYFPTAISLFAQAESKGFMPCLVALNILINCFYHVGQMTLTFSALGKILKVGCQPDTITLNTLMKGLCINNDVVKALDFHDDLVAKGFQLDVNKIIDGFCKEMSPDIVTYNSLVHGFCSMDKWLKAIKLFNQMILEGINPNIHSFNILVGAFCKEGRVTKAKAIVGMMMKSGVKPDEVTYNSLMNWYCLINNVSELSELFNKMVKSGLAPNIICYSILINGFCKIKTVDDAFDLFKEMKRKNLFPDIVTYSSLVDVNGHPLDVQAYNEMIHGLCRKGLFDEAKALLYKMKENECPT